VPFVALAIVVALVTATVTGGNLHRVVDRAWRRTTLVFGALAIQLTLDALPHIGRDNHLAFAALLVSYALLLAFCAVNLSQRGVEVVATGIAMNVLVIAVNHGMPATTAAGAVVANVKHHALANGDHLRFLADIIVVRGIRQLVSFGDLVLALGLVDTIVRASRRAPRLSVHDRHVARVTHDLTTRLHALGIVSALDEHDALERREQPQVVAATGR
jgi:hypothetical protein